MVVIAILAAILFPVFGRARENARRSSCQSNLKQIGLGIAQYTQDYDEKYMAGPSDGAARYTLPTGEPGTWDLLIQPYVKSTQILACPSDSASATATLSGFGQVKRSYAMAQYMWKVPAPDPGFWVNRSVGISVTAIPAPSLTLMVADGG